MDTSDHEVNIKILLDKVVADGDLTEKQRNDVIASMTDEVAALVLKSNYRQNIALANASAQAPALLHVHADWVRRLERQGLLDRELEFLPSVAEFKRRKADGRGLTPPELSVLLAYTKIVLESELLKTSLPDDEYLSSKLASYFPQVIQERFAEPMDVAPVAPGDHRHPGGERVRQHVGDHRVPPAVAGDRRHRRRTWSGRTWRRAGSSTSRTCWRATPSWTTSSTPSTQTRMRLETRTLVERATRWLVSNRRPPVDIAELVDYFAPGIAKLTVALPDLLRGRELALFEQRRQTLVDKGVGGGVRHPDRGAAPGVRRTGHRRDGQPRRARRTGGRQGPLRPRGAAAARPVPGTDRRRCRGRTAGRRWRGRRCATTCTRCTPG